MDFFVENALKGFFKNRSDLFGEQSEYLDFQVDEKYSGEGGLRSTLIFGRISYLREAKNCTSDSLVIKKMVQKIIFHSASEIFHLSNECFFYTEIIPFFNQYYPMDSLFPKYYQCDLRVNSRKKQGLIILENLQASGLRLAGKKSFLDYDHLSLMLRKLGNFHACSYKAKKEDAAGFRSLCDLFSNTMMPYYRKYNYLYTGTATYRLQGLKKCPQYSQKLLKVEKLLSSMPEVVEEILNGDRNSRVAVLCHGDYLSGNVMFKYESGKPVDLRIIDTATCILASPAVDLAQTLYLNADQEMRNEHWDDLIDSYYAGLRESFEDIEIPTRGEILAEFCHKSFIAYIIASYFLNRCLTADKGLETFDDHLPKIYRNFGYEDVPQDVLLSATNALGGDLVTKAISNVLKDMMDRDFF